MGEIQFPHEASELSAFAVSVGVYVISLKNGKIISHVPDDEDRFYEWLVESGARDITDKLN
ncbi:MAG: hypothetical protein JST82_01435 [Bacteroidetes bacterium]|nr:hypothetical protein [Bacteroidota bacterium]